MAAKTITVDMDACKLPAAARRSNESFSTVIKNVLVPASHTASSLLQYLDTTEQGVAALEHDMIAAESPTPYVETAYDS